MAIDLPASEAERAARGLIEQASTALAKRRRDIPATFIAQLYARSVPEDMVRYGAEDIAALAERAYDFNAEREPGRPKIRCETVPLSASGNRKTISVLEIVNDDMPFLVDSVMGEIADRRLDVWLVAHPVLGVRRIGNKLAALGNPDAGEGKRESFIHIHLAPIADDTQCDELVHALQTVLGEVQLAVYDWRPMLDRVTAIATELKSNPPPLPVDEIAEAIQFLQWLLADNFTLIGEDDRFRRRGPHVKPYEKCHVQNLRVGCGVVS